MCDFSLHAVRSRPAKVGDKLTTRMFNLGTSGFCAPEDRGMAVCLLHYLPEVTAQIGRQKVAK
jgi:hypothetical protein